MGKNFIQFDDVRLRSDLITNYGISYDPLYYTNIYKITKVICKPYFRFFKEISFEWEKLTVNNGGYDCLECSEHYYQKVKDGIETPVYGLFDNNTKKYVKISDDAIKVKSGYVCAAEDYYKILKKATPDDVWKRKRKYLYVTTEKKDNFKFYEDEVKFNINDKLKELDCI